MHPALTVNQNRGMNLHLFKIVIGAEPARTLKS